MRNFDDEISLLLAGVASPQARRAALRRLRRYAERYLRKPLDDLGIAPESLHDNDRAVEAGLLIRQSCAERSVKDATLLMRWCIEAEERGHDALIAARIAQALRNLEASLASEGACRARAVSQTRRREQAAAVAARVAAIFTAAYRPGMGRVALQAAAQDVVRELERRARQRLVTAQEVGNSDAARRATAELEALRRQAAAITLHRAGRWLKNRAPPPSGECQ